MRYNYLLSLVSLVALTLLLTGCEQTVDPVGIPYVERIVVRGLITTGDSIHGIRISRTIPIEEQYTEEKGWVVDADVTIQAEGTSYKAKHDGGGLYSVPGLRVQARVNYRLDVAWHDKHVTATTLAPEALPIDSIRFVPTYYDGYVDTVMEVVFIPRGNSVYGVTDQRTERFGGPGDYRETPIWNSEKIARLADTSSDWRIRLRTQYGYLQTNTGPQDTLWGVLYSFDYPYYDYYRTFSKYDNGNGPFSTGGETTAWNVEGDGLGMFVARARSQRMITP